jgi:hypothetical protein
LTAGPTTSWPMVSWRMRQAPTMRRTPESLCALAGSKG